MLPVPHDPVASASFAHPDGPARASVASGSAAPPILRGSKRVAGFVKKDKRIRFGRAETPKKTGTVAKTPAASGATAGFGRERRPGIPPRTGGVDPPGDGSDRARSLRRGPSLPCEGRRSTRRTPAPGRSEGGSGRVDADAPKSRDLRTRDRRAARTLGCCFPGRAATAAGSPRYPRRGAVPGDQSRDPLQARPLGRDPPRSDRQEHPISLGRNRPVPR